MKKILATEMILVMVQLACSSQNSGHDDDNAEYTATCANPPVNLPTPTETCPVLETTYNSDYTASAPITIKGKKADVIVGTGPTPNSKVPFYFFWHGFLGSPTQDIATIVVDPSYKSLILEEGGVVVGLYGDFSGTGGSIILEFDNGHLEAADELLACAMQQFDIDICRIHSSGMSMGGLMTTQLSYLRSDYLASAVSCSGGLPNNPPADQNPLNKLPVMIAYGGSGDTYPPFNFQDTSIRFFDDLKANGHFSFICNHNEGHTVPDSIVTAGWQFLRDHPYGITPEPYASGLPATFPPYCSLENLQPATPDAGKATPDAGEDTYDDAGATTDEGSD